MPSSFPGMNPYLESPDVWRTFHIQAMTAMAEQIVIQVRPDYLVHMQTHLWIHLHVDIERQRYIEIRDRRNRQLVTVVELLSPANKRPGENWEKYQTKRSEALASTAHVVEIDLLRGGRPMPDRDRPSSKYGIMVSRAEERPLADFWPVGLRDRLPIIPVPLRGEAYASLNLQQIVHHVYDHGTYADEIYGNDPDPELEAPALEWARQLVAASGAVIPQIVAPPASQLIDSLLGAP